MVHLSLAFAGIDRIDGSVEEADSQHRLLIQLGQAATIGCARDRTAIPRKLPTHCMSLKRVFSSPPDPGERH